MEKELTKEQEEQMLEDGREKDFEEKDRNGYDDFFSENETDLKLQFIEDELNADEDEHFRKYCKEQFERWKADKE